MRPVLLLVLIFLLAATIACRREENDAPKGRAVYYWRTTLRLSPYEKEFLESGGIETVYLHLFDVVRREEGLGPANSLLFHDTLPKDIEIIPTVFIDPGALSQPDSADSLASAIINRCDRMLTENGYSRPEEIQIDYDWTGSDRVHYFRLLEKARDIMHRRGGRLSTTVRLHQLSQPAPPADYGALMVYNVGNITDPDENNSILNLRIVDRYIGALREYRLPIATALPVYSWNIVFSDDRFKAIAHSLDVRDTAMFRPVDSIHYRAMHYGPLAMAGKRDGSGGRIFPGDIVRHESVSPAILETVLERIRKIRPGSAGRVIIYHLDEKSLRQYDQHFLQKILGGSSRQPSRDL